MDAHAKNLSFLYHLKQIRIAPFYDMLCTTIYEGLSQKLAMKIGTENRLEWIMGRHWEKLAVEINIHPGVLKKQLLNFCHKMMNRLEKPHPVLFKGHERNEFIQEIIFIIKERSEQTIERLG